MVKFDFDEAFSDISNINTYLERIKVLLDNTKQLFDTITNSDNWNGYAVDYYLSELNILYKEINNVNAVSDNIKSYLAGVQENYKALDNPGRSSVHHASQTIAGGHGRKF